MHIPSSFLGQCTNLQELELIFPDSRKSEKTQSLEHAILPQLKILKCKTNGSVVEDIIKFLNRNGRSLEEISFDGTIFVSSGDSLNVAVFESCPNVKSLSTRLYHYEVSDLKRILKGCRQLERIKVHCGGRLLDERELLNMIVEFSPETFCELKIFYEGYVTSSCLEGSEPFFIRWADRVPLKSLSLIIVRGFGSFPLRVKEEDMEVIENFKSLGVIRNFEIVNQWIK
jgi:hypothetical protein